MICSVQDVFNQTVRTFEFRTVQYAVTPTEMIPESKTQANYGSTKCLVITNGEDKYYMSESDFVKLARLLLP